ncbi:hypothetical protein C8R43DRAFT_637556 [Mycena crocata]|nr:hypothetical protein C8R43DRAFT_637556 [Mycena crocata]
MPHPDLASGNIFTLPISYKRFAGPAVNGSLPDFRKLMDLLKRNPHSDPALFLPVYYANLNPALIPTAAELDSWTDHVSPINRALLALEGTTQLWTAGYRWPEGVLSDLWPRIWSWINFLDTFSQTIQSFIPLSEVDAYSLYMRSIIEVLTNSTVVPLSRMPPGMRVLAGRAWRITFPPILGKNTMAYSDVVRFLGNDKESGRPSNFREYLEGVGTVDDFAALVIRHIAHAMPKPKPFFLFYELSGMLRMVVERNDHSGPLHQALLDHGMVKTVTDLACHYATSPAEETVEVVAMCFTLLHRAFNAFPSYPEVSMALENDTLIALIKTCAERPGSHWNQSLRRLLQTVLPRSMVSYHVVTVLPRPHVDGHRLFPVLDFQDAELSAIWEHFVTLATRTASTCHAYDSRAYQWIRACDNVECGRLCRKSEIKRCSSCHQTNYCSVRCQSVDWRVDGHRDLCSRLRPLRLAEYTMPSVRDNYFLHALVRHEYEQNIVAWCMAKVRFMYAYPLVPFYVLCDYTRGSATVTVKAIGDPPPNPARSDASAAQWADQTARMARSDGRIEIIVVLVAVGTRKLRRMAALRTETSALTDRLAGIAAGLEPGLDSESVKNRIRIQIDAALEERRGRGEDKIDWSYL